MTILNIKQTTVLMLAVWSIGSAAVTASAQGIGQGAKMPLANEAFETYSGSSATLSGLRGGSGTVLIFWSNECPWVNKLEGRVQSLVNEFSGRGIGFVLINSNDPVAFPKESPASGIKSSWPDRYLVDKNSTLARALGASRTPHVFLFDASDALVFSGAVDDSPGDPGNVKNAYLKDALNAILSGSGVSAPETKAFGCTIKLKG